MDKLIIPPKFSESYAARPLDMAILQTNPWLEVNKEEVVSTKTALDSGTKTQTEYETLKSEYDKLLADAITAVKAVK